MEKLSWISSNINDDNYEFFSMKKEGDKNDKKV